MWVTFEDITVSFSQEEWGYLDDGQKELYREVMKENYEILISLGADSLTVTPEIISHIKRGEEPYIRDEPGSEEREPGISSHSADHQITQKRKRGKNHGEHAKETEQIQRELENVCENISQGPNRRNTSNCQQESEEQRDPAGDSPARVTEHERNDMEQLTNSPEPQRHLPERPFQNNSSDQVPFKLHHGETKGKKDQKDILCTAHNKNTHFICNKCNKRFTLFSELEMHQRSYMNKKPVTCTECNKSFTLLSNLKIHQMSHTGNKQFVCNESFTLLSNLKIHQMIHIGNKPFASNECNKNLAWLSNLKINEIIHTGEKPFACSECNKSFTQLSNLKSHQKTHRGDKPFICNECNKSFTWPSNLKSHQKIHRGDKPFKCIECNKSFTWPSNLKKNTK